MEANVLKRKELHVPDNSWGFHLYCITRRGKTALAFESRMQNNYIQLTKDSLGRSPTENCTWQDQAELKDINWFEFCTPQVLINTSAVPWLLNMHLLGMNSWFNPSRSGTVYCFIIVL